MFPRRGAAALLVTTVALVLLLSFKTPDDPLPARDGSGVAVVERGITPSVAPRASARPRATDGPATAASPAPTAASGGGGTAGATNVDGPMVDTQFGPVQVRIDVAAGRIADVVALQLPTGRHSGQISSYAAPVLRQEALQAQSAKIDTVSGATYTSDAYAQSLQAALDKAGLG
jgi:uncharacterized protein with FMN-binding domain